MMIMVARERDNFEVMILIESENKNFDNLNDIDMIIMLMLRRCKH